MHDLNAPVIVNIFFSTVSDNQYVKLGDILFENSVDPDQLASEKPADQDPHCICKDRQIAGILKNCRLVCS